MFTGIIESIGTITSWDGFRLEVQIPAAPGWEPWALGESVAIDGCCLTVVAIAEAVAFELSEETVRRTTIGARLVGDLVNVERAARLGDRLGGHIVQGHVDDVVRLVSITPTEQAHIFRFALPAGANQYIIDKGSIALNGISLTVVDPLANEFNVWVIPHTMSHTTLGQLTPGASLNVEYDMVAKYVEKSLLPHVTRPQEV